MFNYKLCPLCGFIARKIKNDDYYKCFKCKSVFLDKKKYVSFYLEKERYLSHDNNVDDSRYRRFTSPIAKAVLDEQSKNSIGLDFGSGTGPVISEVLKENNYNIKQYDPFFANNRELLKKQYDYIVCCEVVEHFKDPKKDFKLLKNLLKKDGTLYIMTHIYKNDIHFKDWYYRQDPTHVFIYQKETFNYIFKKFKFKSLKIEKKLVILRN